MKAANGPFNHSRGRKMPRNFTYVAKPYNRPTSLSRPNTNGGAKTATPLERRRAMHMTDEQIEARGEKIMRIRDRIAEACNETVSEAHGVDDSAHDSDCYCYENTMLALITVLTDFIFLAPEVKQAETYKLALSMLEDGYVAKLTKGAL
jgi:hypothetical protein